MDIKGHFRWTLQMDMLNVHYKWILQIEIKNGLHKMFINKGHAKGTSVMNMQMYICTSILK